MIPQWKMAARHPFRKIRQGITLMMRGRSAGSGERWWAHNPIALEKEPLTRRLPHLLYSEADCDDV